ncbi:hypothetical protein LZ198_19900 [Myxococcus sp. K15C18031901]|uniref:hypothetical protein n=1 Tax=Myxococcus dinghuensis TaxID=2906761 RepID=UPI0020A74661|nr:hypothetical protein [Myxococcus dinghuensis]MCP3101143.1 hypothetical protein [Myxococcus dinghuensis]
MSRRVSVPVVWMLACGLSGCLARRPSNYLPSEQLALSQCLAEEGLPPGPSAGRPECNPPAMRFLLELESRATCREDRDCDDVLIWTTLGIAEPAFVAVNRAWWEAKGKAKAEQLKCAIICGVINSRPSGAVCRRNRCELVQGSYLLTFHKPQESVCARRFAWRRELPAWP